MHVSLSVVAELMSTYLQELKKHHVFDIVRVCEPTYTTKQLEDSGINVLVTNVIHVYICPASISLSSPHL